MVYVVFWLWDLCIIVSWCVFVCRSSSCISLLVDYMPRPDCWHLVNLSVFKSLLPYTLWSVCSYLCLSSGVFVVKRTLHLMPYYHKVIRWEACYGGPLMKSNGSSMLRGTSITVRFYVGTCQHSASSSGCRLKAEGNFVCLFCFSSVSTFARLHAVYSEQW